MAKYIAASEASKKEAAEYNEAKAKEITASHELQLENAKAVAPKVSLKLPAKPTATKTSPAKTTSDKEESKEQHNEESKEQPNEQTKEQPKEESKEQHNEESKEQPNEESKEQPNEESKEESKELPKEQPKEESKEQQSEEDVFGPDSEDDEDGVEADLEEFTHNGETLFKMADEENEGCFLILNRAVVAKR